MAATATAPRVLLRLRPRRDSTSPKCIEVLGTDSVRFRGDALQAGDNATFTLDGVFGETCTQATLFDACRPVVDALLESYNGTIMAYGQTGSGKTHSLFGTTQQPGIVPQVIRTLLQQLGNATLRMSVVELYCERIRDLLQGRDNLAIATDRERGVYIVDASEVEVRDDEEALKTVQVALGRRAVAATNMNERSSRSHCMVTLTLTKRCRGGHRISKLCLVDLAGSERQDKTGAEGTTLDEAKLINKSLSCLGNVVNALTQQAAHVPYRESKLTRVLQDSLGGNARTIVLLCASPTADAASETLSSLRFGVRARGLHNMVVQSRPTNEEKQEPKGGRNSKRVWVGAAACAVQAAAFAAYFYWDNYIW